MSQSPSQSAELPKIGLTMGDPAGVGPELLVRAWPQLQKPQPQKQGSRKLLAIGSSSILRQAAQQFQSKLQIESISAPEEAEPSEQVLPCLTIDSDSSHTTQAGILSAAGGQAAHDALELATDLVLRGHLDGITTGPLHKKGLQLAGYSEPGHTELLAKFCGKTPEDVAMMLYVPPGGPIQGARGLGVVHVTLHTAMQNIFSELTTTQIVAKTKLLSGIMQSFAPQPTETVEVADLAPPQIGVCALNPHGGEAGLFGREELDLITPAVDQAKQLGIDAKGPYPADTLFMASSRW